VREKNASLICSPLQHHRILSFPQANILRPDDVEIGSSTEQAPEDVIVEVFIREKA
jgi:hypothetical protein